MMLSDNKQFRESANFINRLSGGTFGVIVHDLPVDQFIDAMPQSLPIIESLYTKVFLSDGMTRNSIQFLRPENVVQQMVKYFAHQEDHPPAPNGGSATGWPPNVWRWDYCGPFISSCKKLLRVIVLTEPKIRKSLFQKRRALSKAIEGLGQHGLVGTSDENLMNLHDALQVCTVCAHHISGTFFYLLISIGISTSFFFVIRCLTLVTVSNAIFFVIQSR